MATQNPPLGHPKKPIYLLEIALNKNLRLILNWEALDLEFRPDIIPEERSVFFIMMNDIPLDHANKEQHN